MVKFSLHKVHTHEHCTTAREKIRIKESTDGDSPFEQNKKNNSVVRACMCVCEEQCGRNYFAKVVHKIAQPASLEILASVFYNGYTSILPYRIPK